MAGATEPVDVRADRAVQGAVAVITLGAFVFHQVWVVPVLAVLLASGALLGPAGNPLHRLFAGVIAPRLSPATGTEPASTVREQDALAFALLALAILCVLIGLSGIAWMITLAEGGIAAVAATTGAHLGEVVGDRLRRR